MTPERKRDGHARLTPAQKRLLLVIRSFGAQGATERQIALKLRRTAGRIGTRRQ